MVFEPLVQAKMPGELTVEEIIRVYPALHSLYREWQNTSVTVSYGEHIAGRGGRKDPTANAAMHEIPESRQRAYDAVRRTINETHRFSDGLARLKVIDLIYWKRTHTLAEAAEEAHCSISSAQTYQNDFIQGVKKRMEITDCEGCLHYRHFYNIRACHYCLDTGHLRDATACLVADVRLRICPYYKSTG